MAKVDSKKSLDMILKAVGMKESQSFDNNSEAKPPQLNMTLFFANGIKPGFVGGSQPLGSSSMSWSSD